MKSLNFFHILFTIVTLLFSCSKKELLNNNELHTIAAYSPVYPILIGKQNNPVFRINIQPGKDEGSTLKELVISLKGTTDVEDIKSVAVYYSGKKESFLTENLFAETNYPAKKITFSGSQSLENSSNYFWLSLTLNETVNLDHKIHCAITEAAVNNIKIEIPATEQSGFKRIGHALRQQNDDGVHTYRIPGLATTNEGTLLSVYDIRRNGSVDLQEDIDVGMSRSTDGGQSWEPMKTIMNMGEWGGSPQKENGIGDPSILVDRQTNTIWVAALWLYGHPGERAWFASKPGITPQETGQVMLVKSLDDGKSWSEPINITSQIKDPEWQLLLDGPGKGITMEDGTLVFPAQFKDQNEVPHSTIIYSKNGGETWTIGTGAKSKTTEAQVIQLSDQSLMLNMRDDRGSGPDGKNGTGARSVSITTDLGKTWTEHPTSRKDLPEPVCMASLIKHSHKGKDILLFSNPADQFQRHMMTIKVSLDDGMTWDAKYHTLVDEGNGRGYSCMTSIDETTIGILYEGSQSDLVFQRIDLDKILN